MKRSRLRNKFLREKNQANRDSYRIQRNLCKKLLRKTKNSYFSNLDNRISSNIKNKNFDSIFSFKETTPEEVVKVIRNLNIRKSCHMTDIPTEVVKLNSDILAKFI